MADLPVNLYEVLSVFATLKIQRTAETNPSFSSSKSLVNIDDDSLDAPSSAQKKHLRLLNGVAVLLVTEGTSDVAAATMTSHAQGDMVNTTFHVIKNRECTEKERAYFEKFVTIINEKEIDYSSMRDSLSTLVLQNCRAKIVSRATKLRKAVDDVKKNFDTWRVSNDSMKEEIPLLRELCKPSVVEEASFSDLLTEFLTNRMDPNVFAETKSPYPLWSVFLFVKLDGIMKSLGSPKLIRRLNKMADYARAIKTIVTQAKHKNDKKIFTLDIRSSPRRIDLPSVESPLTIINRCARSMQPAIDEFTLKDIKSVAAGVREKDITMSRSAAEAFVHCECALALSMRPIMQETMKIGVSKNCCWPCLEFLTQYSNKAGQIMVSNTHGKTYHSWLFPNGVSDDIYNQVERSARKELHDWIRSLNGRRRSDSDANSSGEEDEPLSSFAQEVLKIRGEGI